MAKIYDRQLVVRGTKKEQQIFTDKIQHYEMATEDNESRWLDWDARYELFRNYIDEDNWPYNSLIFAPQTFTAIFEKMARMNGGRPRGRLVPRGGDGDVVGAKINNELLNFQWDEVGRHEHDSMVRKWARMDLQTRIYGSSFAVARWQYQCDSDEDPVFDGPTLKVLHPKDSLPNPSYSRVKNWFQYREFVTLKELETVNNVSGKKPKYKNLDLLKQSVEERARAGGDQRDVNYTPRGKEISGLQDFLGRDEQRDYKTVEIVTELEDENITVFAPRHGVILHEGKNPYNHKQIPVVQLSYISIDDDIWGLSEIEPVEKIQKAINALLSQYVDKSNMDLYRIIKAVPQLVDMHTLEWGPGKVWKMRQLDAVAPLEHSPIASNEFINVYSVLTALLKEAMGETSAAFSQMQPFGTEKTATEIQEGMLTRSVRDNFNQVFLGEAIEQQMMYWFLMNKQFIFSDPTKLAQPIRIVGREAIQEFRNMGLDEMRVSATEEEVLQASVDVEMGEEPQLDEVPAYPVVTEQGLRPKFDLDETGEYGSLLLTPEDMTGNYDYIADVEPMTAHSSIEEKRVKRETFSLLANPITVQLLAQEGKTIKFSEVLIDLFDTLGMKNADKYFEVTGDTNVQTAGVNPGGAAQGGAGQPAAGAQGLGGMEDLGGVAQEAGLPQLGGSQGF